MSRNSTEKAAGKTGIRILSVLAIAAAVLFLFIGLRQYTKEDGYVYLIGLSQPDLSDNAQLALYNDIALSCAAEDIRLISYDAGQSTAKQRNDIRTLTEIGVDALIISSDNAEAMADVIGNAYHAGITVILIGSIPVTGECSCHVVPDRYAAGRIAGEYMAGLFPEENCTVLEIYGEARSRISKDLQYGFQDAIDRYNNIINEYVMTGYWTEVDTQERLIESRFFSLKPAVNAIFAHNDSMAIAAAITAEERGKEVVIIGVGGYALPNSDLQAVRDGRLQATVYCPTGGKEAVDLAVRIIRDGQQPPDTVTLEPELVTAANVDAYLQAERSTDET